jgi:RNA polymerase sigma factor (sigma-70 family)
VPELLQAGDDDRRPPPVAPVPGRSDPAGPADDDLVRGVVDGATSAFADLYDRYGRRAYSLARRICADEGLAEDVVQEAFLAFWREPHRFDPQRGRFGSWFLTLVHHKAVDAVRRQSAATRRTVPEVEEGQERSLPTGPGADQDALAALDASRIRAALGELPVDQGSALALAYFGGWTQREVAVLTGVPLGTVKSRMFTGIRRMRELLGPTFAIADGVTDSAAGGAR